ncbi:MAG: serine/threonine protein kinase, partial [Chloroflexi bacterium]|nr:serine/threonine protein kinase [Chloroflexota bacterium]
MQRLGRYEIIDEIGRGGMGVVYRARDQRFNREVAIKVLPRAISSREELAERFNREAQAIARLEHNAIVPVYDYGDENGALYLVMRLMGGGSLADRIVKGPMNIEEAAPIISRVAEALDAAHDRGLIHRDVKPGNILFDAYGAAFLSDFGIVKLDEAATMLTGTGAVGTPAYMAPEMADGVVSPAGDIYSLGVTLYQMLTGQLPFRGTTPIAMIMAHISEPVPDLRVARPDLPEAVQAIVEKGLAKKPENRFPNAQRMAKALAAVADGPASTVKRPPNRAEIEARLKATAPMPQTRGPQPPSSPPPP